MAEWIGMALLSAGGLALWAWVWQVNKRGREDRLTLERVRVHVNTMDGKLQSLDEGVERLMSKYAELGASLKNAAAVLDANQDSFSKYIEENNHEFEDLQKRVRALEETVTKPNAVKKGKRR